MRRRIQDVLKMVVRGGLTAAVLAGAMAVAQAPAQTPDQTPAQNQAPAQTDTNQTDKNQAAPAATKAPASGQAQGQTAAPAQSAPLDAPAPGPQQFAFPVEDSKSKELPGEHEAAPDAPAPNAPAPANDHPFPGGDKPAPTGGGYSSSGDTAAPNDAPDTAPPTPVRRKLELNDVGSSGHIDTARADKDANVADFYIKDGNYKGAYLRYKDAVVFDPDNPDAHFGLAEMARKTGKPAEAIEQYNATLKLDLKNKHAKEARKALDELQAAAEKK